MPFSQTMRSLITDQARLSFIGLLVIVLLILAWLAWFLLARIDRYEVSAPVQLPLEDTVVADFPADSLARIKSGQPAILYLDSPADGSDTPAAATLPAEVMDVTLDEAGQVQVWLQPQLDETFFDNPQVYTVNRIDIKIDHISPLTLLTQSYY